jgi:hypothetical protein
MSRSRPWIAFRRWIITPAANRRNQSFARLTRHMDRGLDTWSPNLTYVRRDFMYRSRILCTSTLYGSVDFLTVPSQDLYGWGVGDVLYTGRNFQNFAQKYLLEGQDRHQSKMSLSKKLTCLCGRRLSEFTDWRYRQSCWYLRPGIVNYFVASCNAVSVKEIPNEQYGS